MGVSGLWDLLAPSGRTISLTTLGGRRVAVDASIWLVQFLSTVEDRGDDGRTTILAGIFNRICKLLYNGIRPVFVFDGERPALKAKTLQQRRTVRQKNLRDVRALARKLLVSATTAKPTEPAGVSQGGFLEASIDGTGTDEGREENVLDADYSPQEFSLDGPDVMDAADCDGPPPKRVRRLTDASFHELSKASPDVFSETQLSSFLSKLKGGHASKQGNESPDEEEPHDVHDRYGVGMDCAGAGSTSSDGGVAASPAPSESSEESFDTCIQCVSETNSPSVESVACEEEGVFDVDVGETEHIIDADAYVASTSSDLSHNPHVPDVFAADLMTKFHEMLELFGIPYVTAPFEADSQCAIMNTLGLVDAVVSDDSDVFLFGAATVYRNLFSSSSPAECYTLQSIREALGIGREQMVCLAMLLGSDYTAGVRNIGIVHGLEVLQSFTGFDGLKQFAMWVQGKVECSNLPPQLISARRRFQLPDDELFPSIDVYLAYLEPPCDRSTEKFSWGVVDEGSLKRFAEEVLNWPEEKASAAIAQVLHRRQMSSQRTMDQYLVPSSVVGRIRSGRLRDAVENLKKRARKS